MWADRYDRDLTDIFAIQDEISKAIVAALRVKLLPEEKKAIETRGTASVEAYNLYLMARQHWINGSFGDIRRDETIVRICQQAVSIDPELCRGLGADGARPVAASLVAWLGTSMRFRPPSGRCRSIRISPKPAASRRTTWRSRASKRKRSPRSRRRSASIPNSWEANREAARLMFRAGPDPDAIPFFEKATAVMETDWHNPAMLMTCYQGAKDTEQLKRVARITIERVEKAISKDPSNAPALSTGASALAILGEDDRANGLDRPGAAACPGRHHDAL